MELRSALMAPLSIGRGRFFTKGLESQTYLHVMSGARRSLRIACHGEIVQVKELDDPTIVDMQEASNGYVLFKFGTTQVYDDPPRFIASSAQNRRTTSIAVDDEVIDCSAVVYRLPNERTLVKPFKWGDGYKAIKAYDNERSFEGHTIRTPLGRPGDFMRPYKLENFAEQLSSFEDVPVSKLLHLSTSSTVDMIKLLPTNIGTLADVNTYGGREARHAKMKSTVSRADMPTKKAKSRFKRGSKVGTRDLFKTNSFQMYELIFCYPFMDCNNKASTSRKGIPKEKYTELLHVLNHVAIGLAGGGLALVLFVASRMLCLNPTLDATKLTALLRGMGLLWLSSAFQKFGLVVRQMAQCDMTARQERREHMAMFRKQMRSVTFQVCTMLMLFVLV